MSEQTLSIIVAAAIALILGIALGWFIGLWRSKARSTALAEQWRDQIDVIKRSEKRINAERKTLSAELAAVRTELAASGNVNDQSLQEKLDQSLDRRDSLNDALQKLIARTQELTQHSKEKDEKIFALSRELESWQQRLPPLLNRYKDKDLQNTIILEQLEAERTRASDLERTLETRVMPLPDDLRDLSEIPLAHNDNDATDRDDLKRIKGVGPILEQTLNELGIYRLTQIADLSDEEIERIATALPQFPGRIERDRWIEQARQLVS